LNSELLPDIQAAGLLIWLHEQSLAHAFGIK
jgi:hypothetical protein